MEEDESGVGGGEEWQEQGKAGGGEGEGEDDEAERKRRQQLADRWSKLEEDSVRAPLCCRPTNFRF